MHSIKLLIKVTSGIIMGYLFLFFIFASCINAKQNISHHKHIKKMNKILKNGDGIYPNENFIFLQKYLITDKNGVYCSEEDNLEDCKKNEPYTSASGIAVTYKKDEVYILTAAHWCAEGVSKDFKKYLKFIGYNKKKPPLLKIRVGFFGSPHAGSIVDYDLHNDVCLVKIKSRYASKIKKIKIAKKQPKLGDKVYTISAPDSIYSPTTRLHFDGRFSGCGLIEPFCLYTIPGTFGSSGSGILNSKGELVGILAIAIQPFDHVTGASSVESIKKIIDKNLK